VRRRDIVLGMALAAATLVCKTAATTAGSAQALTMASVPDFSGVWRHSSLVRAARIGCWAGHEPVATKRREQLQPTCRRLHQSDPAALGGADRQSARRNLVSGGDLSKSRQPVSARAGPVHFQEQRDADIAATPPGDDPLRREPSIPPSALERASPGEYKKILAMATPSATTRATRW
jgi:hypothetical protein